MITLIDKQENAHEILVTSSHLAHSCMTGASAQSSYNYYANLALPYINSLLQNIHDRFSGEAVFPLHPTPLTSYSVSIQHHFLQKKEFYQIMVKKKKVSAWHNFVALPQMLTLEVSLPPHHLLSTKQVFMQERKWVMEVSKITK